MKQKGFAPILIVLLIALAVGGYLLYQKQTRPDVVSQPVVQPSSNPVISPVASDSAETTNSDLIGANWKTYTNTNTKYGFSVKYPESWYFISAEENYGADYKGAKVEILFSNKLKGGKIPSGVDIDRSTAHGLIAVDECNYKSGCDIWTSETKFYDTKNSLWQSGGGGAYLSTRKVSLSQLGGKKAILIESQADTNAEVYKGEYSIQYNVFLENEHLTLTFTYNSQNKDNEQVLNKFNQILSTFKFN